MAEEESPGHGQDQRDQTDRRWRRMSTIGTYMDLIVRITAMLLRH
jgi:hypothetical protein